MIQKWLRLGLFLLLPLGALTCSKAEEQRDVLRVGFVPAENAQQVALNAQPIVQILQKELGLEVQPFVATDYTGVIEALRANKASTGLRPWYPSFLRRNPPKHPPSLSELRRVPLAHSSMGLRPWSSAKADKLDILVMVVDYTRYRLRRLVI